jgi:hypothetical protein
VEQKLWQKHASDGISPGTSNSLFIIIIQAGQKLVFGFWLFPATKPSELIKFKG